ncbi:MAG: carbohydrate kinase family protein [Anaerolineae bacterium]|nr:carbohydrate kinase family protein [Anaerolineae bacterium]
MTIVCTGSIAYDYLMSFPGYFKDHILPEQLEKISLSFLVDTMVKQRGGTAPNIAYTLALLGERPLLLGTVGEDFEDYRCWLGAQGVDTSLVKVIPGKFTASFFANTDLSNAQIASFYTGAMAHASELSLLNLENRRLDLVVISPNDPKAMDQYVQECSALKIPFLYDPSQQIVRLAPEELRRGVENAQCVFVNEYELELLQKHTGISLGEMLKKIEYMVVTMGEDGAVIYAEGREYRVKAVKPGHIQDPTGVGDAFRGGFLRGKRLGLDWITCGQMGALAATYCLEQTGPQNHHYTIPEYIARYRKNFDDHGKLDVLLK